MRRDPRYVNAVAALVAAWLWAGAVDVRASLGDEPSGGGLAEEVGRLLEGRCLKCHSGDKAKGGLDLSTRDGLIRGGDSGPAVEEGDEAVDSLLYQVVAHETEPAMPQGGEPLADEQVARIADWIKAGVPYPRALQPPAAPGRGARGADHWAFRPLRRPDVPAVGQQRRPRTPIDRFLDAALEAKGIEPAPEADRRTLIRRLAFDLTGLPPTPEEVEGFVDDDRPDAYERLVDRFLASPQYGERWGRHWLDLARYADSDGYESDHDRVHAYPYRDFVVRALNDDLPFDAFARWQIAGDELGSGDPRAVAATGFVVAGPNIVFNVANEGTPEEREKLRYDELDDVLATTGTAFLGLTVGCARCHDHKFDPIPTRDYYRMLAAFVGTRRDERPLLPPDEIASYKERMADADRMVASAKGRLDAWDRERLEPLRERDDKKQAGVDELVRCLSSEERAERDALVRAMAEAEATRPAGPPVGLVPVEAGPEPVTAYLLDRGDPAHKAGEVGLGFLTVLADGREPVVAPPIGAASSYRRAALADWLVDVDHGAGRLVARVAVNRLWQHHFGDGLVRTPSDFGTQGDPPSHPELLDWLASELIDQGWRLKPIHRLIVLSDAYRRGTAFDPASAKIDPENRLLWHRRPTRLEAEAVRDAILAVSGGLDPAIGGPAIKPFVPPEAMAGRNRDDAIKRPESDGPEQWRRSVYLFTKRTIPTPLLEVFDAPGPVASCGRRTVSTVAPQALTLLNDPFVRGQARRFADRLRREAGDDREAIVRHAYALAIGRPPTARERERASAFLARAPDDDGLVDFGQVLFSINEFLYID